MQKEKRKSFVIYTDYMELVEELDDAETAEMFKAMLIYASGEDVPKFSDRHVKAIFGIIRRQMDRDNEKYEEIVRKRREASRKAVEARKEKKQNNQTSANGNQTSANLPDNDNENGNENVNDNENVNGNENDNNINNVIITHALPPKSPQGGTASEKYEQDKNFMSFWSVYPKKSGVNAAFKAWKSISPDDALTERITAAVRKQCQASQWREDNGRYIPFPANWLRTRRWEDKMDINELRDYSCMLDHALNVCG